MKITRISWRPCVDEVLRRIAQCLLLAGCTESKVLCNIFLFSFSSSTTDGADPSQRKVIKNRRWWLALLFVANPTAVVISSTLAAIWQHCVAATSALLVRYLSSGAASAEVGHAATAIVWCILWLSVVVSGLTFWAGYAIAYRNVWVDRPLTIEFGNSLVGTSEDGFEAEPLMSSTPSSERPEPVGSEPGGELCDEHVNGPGDEAVRVIPPELLRRFANPMTFRASGLQQSKSKTHNACTPKMADVKVRHPRDGPSTVRGLAKTNSTSQASTSANQSKNAKASAIAHAYSSAGSASASIWSMSCVGGGPAAAELWTDETVLVSLVVDEGVDHIGGAVPELFD
ncbi:hypothetical protein QBC34DRAFT_493299 [Podospora aff. communis PSN243]|uniref:Membrane-associated protein n=1 Tax=Podospora aff. communis PSN243 TaxID=3040156 RepID=A0AAV9GT93_9PEZI|nr:hypothetical protein QBC34DRAFT_493299 [Podospora aff. communis PSN243]